MRNYETVAEHRWPRTVARGFRWKKFAAAWVCALALIHQAVASAQVVTSDPAARPALLFPGSEGAHYPATASGPWSFPQSGTASNQPVAQALWDEQSGPLEIVPTAAQSFATGDRREESPDDSAQQDRVFLAMRSPELMTDANTARLSAYQTPDAATSESASVAGGGQNSDDKIGQAPVDNSRVFLRTQSVLLKRHQLQFDTGGAYATIQVPYPDIVGTPATLAQGYLTRRLFYAPVQLRYGVTDRIQVFANTVLGYAMSENSVAGSYANFQGVGGAGDTNLGASILLRRSTGCTFDPDIIGTLGFAIPTAKASFLSALSTPQTSLGQGFWAGFWNLLAVQTYDPVTVFYGFGGRQLVGQNVSGSYIQPGQQFNYQLGAGFAVNERVTLSTIFQGTVVTTPYVNSVSVPGGSFETQYVRFAATISRRKRIIEPYVYIGLTAASARSIIGLNYTFY